MMLDDEDATQQASDGSREELALRAAIAEGRAAALEHGLDVRKRSLVDLHERVLRIERERATLEQEVVAVRRDLERTMADLVDERARREAAEAGLAAIENTKTFRWLRPARDAYEHLRRASGSRLSG
jgi:predicted  nucleic acid-binding Zn-ribbon protein